MGESIRTGVSCQIDAIEGHSHCDRSRGNARWRWLSSKCRGAKNTSYDSCQAQISHVLLGCNAQVGAVFSSRQSTPIRGPDSPPADSNLSAVPCLAARYHCKPGSQETHQWLQDGHKMATRSPQSASESALICIRKLAPLSGRSSNLVANTWPGNPHRSVVADQLQAWLAVKVPIGAVECRQLAPFCGGVATR
jgi:hypothetical protein